MNIPEYFVKRPVIFWSLVVAILIAGVLSFTMMPKLEDPAVSAKQANVVIIYPGASAHQMELDVAQLMESSLRTLPDVQKIKTECQSMVAVFTVEFKMSVPNRELQEHFDMLRRKVNDISGSLPSGCQPPMVIDDMTDVYGIFYALSGEGYTNEQLTRYAQYIRRSMLEVSGVKRVLLTGSRQKEISITINKEQLVRNGMLPMEILISLQSEMKTLYTGSYRNAGEQVAFRVSGQARTAEDIANIQLKTMDGSIVRLGDVAKVEESYSEPHRNGFYINGQEAIAICGAMDDGVIVPNVGQAVDEKLAEVEKQLPVGMTITKVYNQPDKVHESINGFMINLIESILIVIFVLVLFMGMKSGLIVGGGLLLTVCLSFPILLTLGTTLQRISLGAFIIAMGMLVDNAVVIMDGIIMDRKKGLPPSTYLYRIGRNTALPLLGATVVAAATFIAVYLSPDTAGEYAHDLFLVLCVSLLCSWVLALVQVPFCSNLFLKPLSPEESNPENAYNSKVHRFSRTLVTYCVDNKKTVTSLAIALLVASVIGFFQVKILFFPDFDYNQFVVEVFFPSNTDPQTVSKRMLQMGDSVQHTEGVTRVIESMGGAPSHYCLVRPMTMGGDCYGELIVDCKDNSTLMDILPGIRQKLRQQYPDAYIRVRKYNFSVTTSHTVEVEFAGPDPAVLKKLAHQAEDIMRQSEYIDPYSVQNNWKPKGKVLVAEYNPQNALAAGISRSDIGNALQAATDGMPIGIMNDQDKTMLVNLKVRNSDGSRITDMDNIPVWSMLNMHVGAGELQSLISTMGEGLQDKIFATQPLTTATSGVRLDWEEGVVMRLNGKRVIEAEADPNWDNPKATPDKAQADIKDKIEAIELPEGYTMRWVGDGEVMSLAINSLMKYVPITVFLLLLVLLFLFGTWKQVCLILFCVPFIACGITPALLITNQPMTFLSIIGAMGLFGMMIKNAIVLVDEINRQQTEDKIEPYTAVIEATVSRVRPVLMASITTILGMIPLLTDPMYKSMAITIMGGLTVGTIITLLMLPVFYSMIYHVRKAR